MFAEEKTLILYQFLTKMTPIEKLLPKTDPQKLHAFLEILCFQRCERVKFHEIENHKKL